MLWFYRQVIYIRPIAEKVQILSRNGECLWMFGMFHLSFPNIYRAIIKIIIRVLQNLYSFLRKFLSISVKPNQNMCV